MGFLKAVLLPLKAISSMTFSDKSASETKHNLIINLSGAPVLVDPTNSL